MMDDVWQVITVRLPRDLVRRLDEDAKRERRSRVGHLIWLLEQALNDRKG